MKWDAMMLVLITGATSAVGCVEENYDPWHPSADPMTPGRIRPMAEQPRPVDETPAFAFEPAWRSRWH